MDLLKGAGRGAGRAANKLGGFVERNKDIIGGAVKGAQMMMPSASDDAALMNAETGRMRYNLEEKEIEERRKRNQNLMALLMPYLENTGYLNQPG